MSHKTELRTNIDNKDAVIAALTEMGFTVKDEKTELHAFSWRMETDFTVMKDSKVINVGFAKQSDGNYRVESDFWGTGINAAKFQEELNVLHGKHKVNKWMSDNRYQVTYETNDAGDLVVVGKRWN